MQIAVIEAHSAMIDSFQRVSSDIRTEAVSSQAILTSPFTLQGYDLAVIDEDTLAGRDAGGFILNIRRNGLKTPILVSGNSECRTAEGRVRLLDCGADNCQPQALEPQALVAFAKATVRRCVSEDESVFSFGEKRQYTFNHNNKKIMIGGKAIHLTARETRILAILGEHKGVVVPARQISDVVYGHGIESKYNSIEVSISRIRKKLGGNTVNTVKGKGYRLAM